jgi:ATP-dependent Clp protease adaptor protein ClpS
MAGNCLLMNCLNDIVLGRLMGVSTVCDSGAVEVSIEEDSAIATGVPWNVIVLNDPVNLMSYVVSVFKKIFGYNEAKATKLMLEVHEVGRSVVWTGGLEKAEMFAFQLQRHLLLVRLEKA